MEREGLGGAHSFPHVLLGSWQQLLWKPQEHTVGQAAWLLAPYVHLKSHHIFWESSFLGSAAPVPTLTPMSLYLTVILQFAFLMQI